jgi:hypothetical protein
MPHTNDLSWIVEHQEEGEVEDYLSEVTADQFVIDVKALIRKNADKSAISDAIKRLQELL